MILLQTFNKQNRIGTDVERLLGGAPCHLQYLCDLLKPLAAFETQISNTYLE